MTVLTTLQDIRLDAQFNNYLGAMTRTQQDAHGFIEGQNCDSLLFTGLVGCVQGVDVKIDDARIGDVWFRHPVAYQPCVTCGYQRSVWQRIKDMVKLKTTDLSALQAAFTQGGSTISRDMLTGLAWYCWYNKRQDLAEHVVQYALKHGGVMGRGDPSKINIMPGLLATFAWISYKLGGPSRPWLRWIPADFGGTPVDYQAHLQVLHVFLRAQVSGRLSWWSHRLLANQAKRQPQNPLFIFAAGDTQTATNLLDNPQLFPPTALPTTMNYQEGEWLWMRDNGAGWQPAPNIQPPEQHTGGEFVFLWALISGKLK